MGKIEKKKCPDQIIDMKTQKEKQRKMWGVERQQVRGRNDYDCVCVNTMRYFFCQDLTQMSYDFGKKKASVTVSDDLLPVMFVDQKKKRK